MGPFSLKEETQIMQKSLIVVSCIVFAAAVFALPAIDDEVVPEEELAGGGTCNCCGKQYPKPSCSVTLYQHCNYRGYGINLAPGSYNMHALQAKGMKNDDLSSVRVHGTCRAIMYQHWNFGGKVLTRDGNDACFTNDRMLVPVAQLHQIVVKAQEDVPAEDDEEEVDVNGRRLLGRRSVSWNDQISSAKVQDRAAAAHTCTAVCKHPCAVERNQKAAEKNSKAAEKSAKAQEQREKAKAQERKAKESAAKAAEKSKKREAQAKATKKEKDAKKEAAAKAQEKAAKKAEKAAKEMEAKAEKEKKMKEKSDKESAAKVKAKELDEKAQAKKEQAAKEMKANEAAMEKKSKIPPADPCKKYKAQEAANKSMTKTLQKSIRFQPGSTVLTTEGKKTLDSVAAVVIKYAWMALDLTGQSTASGSGCQRLVTGRAKAASEYLKNKGCTNAMNTGGKCQTFIGLTIAATGSAKAPKGCRL